ncbi:MAG: hypothetical protein ACI81L_002720 [Verrucomicrobiales bacterium]
MDTADRLEEFISGPRFATYVTACSGDRDRAVKLYYWTGDVGGALLVDFRHLEVILRNHIHNTLTKHTNEYHTITGEWYEDERWVKHHWWNTAAQRELDFAVSKAGGPAASADRVIAELPFGFWRYVLSARYEQSFWRSALDTSFVNIPGKTWKERRFTIEREVLVLHQLRNRLAHHQPIFKPHMRRGANNTKIEVPLERQHDGLLHVLSWIDPKLPTLVMADSTVKTLLAQRP